MNAFDEAPGPAPAPAEEARHLAAVATAAGIRVTQVVLPQNEHVVLGGMRLHYLDWGSPGGDQGTPGGLPVVFLHGGGLNAHTWDIVCLALREDHRCYALDLRGHGDSEWSPALDYGLGAHLRDLEAFADHLGNPRFFLVGQSLGGIIGIGYASRHPRRLAGLVTVDTGPFAGSQAGIDRLAAFTLDSREFASLEEAITRALAFNPRRDPRLLRSSLQHNMRRLPDGRWTWKRDQRHLSRERLAAFAAQIRELAPQARAIACPTLILRGADSDLFSAGQAAAFAALVRDAAVVTIPHSGHNVQGDNPAGLLAAIRPFLNRLRPEVAH
ncbi:MAG TPA: alpha/beta hydrolase [Streptosporangiaceae bacterium]|nr:alpha/beta hydrolase [Streptosporangiaceae bacterium]